MLSNPLANPLQASICGMRKFGISHRILSFNVVLGAAGSYTLGLSVHPGKTSIVNWGDGTSTAVTYSATDYQDQTHAYASAGTYTIIITASDAIKGIRHASTTNGNISFDLSSIPNVTAVYISGSNTVTGNLSSIPNATFVYIAGSNTVTGNLSSISKATYIDIRGSNTIADYTSGTLWPTSMRRMVIFQSSGFGFDSTEVDNLLIDLAARVTTWTNEKTIDLRGANAVRTPASDAAVATLESRGAVVYTN